MKKSLFYIFSFGLLAVAFSAQTFAQSEEPDSRRSVSAVSSMYVISAKAGGVNFVEGTVNIARKTGRSGLLLKGDTLAIGDKVSTAANGKAEILLNPGSFVRLAGNSEFEFTTTALEDLQLKLNSGSAIFEVITDNEFTFAVNTPKAKFFVVKTGVYRIDVADNGASKIEVWKGKAQVGDVYQTEVKGGREAVVNGSQVTVAKFDRDEKDEFEVFSKARAKQLAKVNSKLQNRDVRTSLMNSFYSTRWSLYDSYGLWVFNRAFGSYAFLPFGYGWSSPYGYYYPSDIWYYNLPPVIYYYPPIRTTPQPATQPDRVGGPGVRNTRAGRGNDSDAVERLRPPFSRIQREIGSFPMETDSGSSPFPSSGGIRQSSSSSSAPVVTDSQPLNSAGTKPPRRGN